MHLELSDAAPQTGTYPIAKGDGAEGVGRQVPLISQPATWQEVLWLREAGLIMRESVMGQNKEGLEGPVGSTES